jgi:hypothetical protein
VNGPVLCGVGCPDNYRGIEELGISNRHAGLNAVSFGLN